MLRTWTGLVYLCMNDLQAIRSLVQAIHVNPNEACDVLLDMLYDLFNINATPLAATLKRSSAPPMPQNKSLNLIDHYLALVLNIFLEAGLLDALVHVIEHYEELRRKASLLVGEVLHLAHRLLPADLDRVHTLPRLFSLASRMHASTFRDGASQALATIEQLNRSRSDTLPKRPAAQGPAIDKAKQKVLMQVDDTTLRNMLLETQILATRDHTKWNTEVLNDLLEGTLHVPKRLEEAMRGSRFLKRLLAFYHPFSLRFSSIRRSRANLLFVKQACSTLKLIMGHPDGAKFLADDALLPQIAECLLQLDESSQSSTGEPLLTPARLGETLSGGYFDMIGVLAGTPEGLQLLEKNQIFSVLHRLIGHRSRDYVLKATLPHLNLQVDGHSKTLLTHALTAGSRDLRLHATHHLAKSLREVDRPSDWMVESLLVQLYDPSNFIKQSTARLLGDLCENQALLAEVVSKRPSLEHLGDIGQPLLLKFLKTSTGLRHLSEGDYVEQNMEEWYHDRNETYRIEIEVRMAQATSIYRARHENFGFAFDGCAPPHFYGELVKTDVGCAMLDRKGHFSDFAFFIQQHGFEERDTEILAKLKSVLWAVVSRACLLQEFR